MNIEDIKRELAKIKRTSFGISIPELRKFAKKLAKEDYKEFIDSNDCSTFELKLLHAFLIGYINDDINTLLKYFQDFMPQVGDWAVNDSLCQNFRAARKYQNVVWKFLMKFKSSHEEFESRIVSVVLLSHFLNDSYINRVIKVLDELDTRDYYSSMGVAWAIATVMAKYPEKCLNYLTSKNCRLDNKTFNRSLQKIRESYRVSKEIKEITKKLKK